MPHFFYSSDHCFAVIEIQNFVDGVFVPSASGQTLDDMEPATNHLLATIPRSNAEDANAGNRDSLSSLAISHLNHFLFISAF
jgi:hypothetical protein